MPDIKVTKSDKTKINDVNWDNPGFGVYLSDHVYVAEYKNGKWQDGEIIPYGPMPIEPAMCTLHYGQTIFEGLKAFRDINGKEVNVFRPDKNAKRLNNSADAVCIPEYDEELFLEGIKKLIQVEEKWIPKTRGHSLYIRPVVYGDGNFLGVHASDTYKLIIMTSPVASYYPEGLNPVRILISDEFVRAVRGGLGHAKTAANYAASLKAGRDAKAKGYSQVLWLDGVKRHFVDEVGAMNIMFVIDGELITPPLTQGSILAGVTRESVIQLAEEMGVNVREESISVDDVIKAHQNGKLNEVFGTGTAAVISPVGELSYKGKKMIINYMKIGKLAQKFYDTITGIQYGEIEDKNGWLMKIPIV
jgi:branched-chain amino acid aminotransferase